MARSPTRQPTSYQRQHQEPYHSPQSPNHQQHNLSPTRDGPNSLVREQQAANGTRLRVARTHHGVSRHSLQQAYDHDEDPMDSLYQGPAHKAGQRQQGIADNQSNSYDYDKSDANGYRGNQDGYDSDEEENNEVADAPTLRACDKYGFFIDSNPRPNGAPGLRNGRPYRSESESLDPKVTLEKIRKREKKWLKMTSSVETWDKWINHRWKKVRDRCRKGIPDSVRGRAWLYLCGAHHLMRRNKNLYKQLLQEPGNESVNDDIRKDINRQFPNHEIFADEHGPGQRDLFEILKAFSILRPNIGYCQGQGPIAAVLLMQMPAEHAFWTLIAICDHYLPNYFSEKLEAIQLHGDMLFALLKRYSPGGYRLLKKQKIAPILYMCEWFMSVFSRNLPWSSVLRVWDMFFCEGKSSSSPITNPFEN